MSTTMTTTTIPTTTIDALGTRAAEAVMRGTAEVLRREGYRPRDYEAATEVIRRHAVEAADEGLRDARQAFDAGMTRWAETTFTASLAKAAAQAGREIIDRQL